MFGSVGGDACNSSLHCPKLLGGIRSVSHHLCLDRRKLLGELAEVADDLILAGPELLDRLLHIGKIA